MFWTKLEKIIGAILVSSSVLAGMLMIVLARRFPAAAVALVGMAAFFGVLAGIFFSAFFLRDIAEAFTGFLLFPRRFLKETPLETGPIYALMRGPDPRQAELYLNGLPPDKRNRPEAVLAKIELYRDILKRPASAQKAAEEYLDLSGRTGNPCGKAILMAFADLAEDKGDLSKVCKVLTRELRSSLYTDREKREIRLRLDTLTKRIGVK